MEMREIREKGESERPEKGCEGERLEERDQER